MDRKRKLWLCMAFYSIDVSRNSSRILLEISWRMSSYSTSEASFLKTHVSQQQVQLYRLLYTRVTEVCLGPRSQDLYVCMHDQQMQEGNAVVAMKATAAISSNSPTKLKLNN